MQSRTLKIAGVAALAGMMMAVLLASVDRKPMATPDIALLPAGKRVDPLARELDRCATLTMPDSGCEAAWAESRRRFFGQSDRFGDMADTDRPSAHTPKTAGLGRPGEMVPSPATEGTRP